MEPIQRRPVPGPPAAQYAAGAHDQHPRRSDVGSDAGMGSDHGLYSLPAVMARRLRYSNALEGWDNPGILSSLADDVVIHVAVHDAPMHGKEIADFLFGVLAEELGEIRITDEIVEG